MQGNQSGIVNPFARQVLSVTMDDQGQVKLDTQLPPEVVVKALVNITTESIMNYVSQMALAAQQGKLQTDVLK